jgi:hypothetical protein
MIATWVVRVVDRSPCSRAPRSSDRGSCGSTLISTFRRSTLDTAVRSPCRAATSLRCSVLQISPPASATPASRAANAASDLSLVSHARSMRAALQQACHRCSGSIRHRNLGHAYLLGVRRRFPPNPRLPRKAGSRDFSRQAFGEYCRASQHRCSARGPRARRGEARHARRQPAGPLV